METTIQMWKGKEGRGEFLWSDFSTLSHWIVWIFMCRCKNMHVERLKYTLLEPFLLFGEKSSCLICQTGPN